MIRGRLAEILDGFSRVKLAVVGDFFLDKTLMISREFDESSVETGLTAYQVTGKNLSPGAAGTVTNNLCALGVGRVLAIGVTGDDGEGYELRRGLEKRGVDTRHLYASPLISTPTYIKPLFMRSPIPEEFHRLDIKNRHPLPVDCEDAIIAGIASVCADVDGVILLDQVTLDGTGVLTPRVKAALASLSARAKAPVMFYDSRERPLAFPYGISKCNNLEAVAALDPSGDADDDRVVSACARAMCADGRRAAVVTMGARGLCVADVMGAEIVPGVRVPPPIDVCGAGDSVSAAFVSTLCAKATLREAAIIGNLVASITVQQIGTTGTATRDQVLARFEMYNEQNGGDA